MTNEAVYGTVDWAVYWAVSGAVNRALPLAVYLDANGVVHWAVAQHEKSPHPGLGIYLAAVG